jgi:hypothetical protein
MSEQYQFLVNDLYDPETGVVDETALDKLNALQDSIENKCINITKLFKSIELTQEMIKTEKERLIKREKMFKNQVTRLKEYLQMNMERCEIKKIESPEFTISMQNNPPSVEILDPNQVPCSYDKDLPRELNLKKIMEDLKNGLEIPGVRLVQRQSVRIR